MAAKTRNFVTTQPVKTGDNSARANSPQNSPGEPQNETEAGHGGPAESAGIYRALAHPQTITSREILQLQRTIGNRAVQRLLAQKSLPKPKTLVNGSPTANRAPGSLPQGSGVIQRKRLTPPDSQAIWQAVYKNIKTGNLALALHAVKVRVLNGQLDKEDIDTIADFDKGLTFQIVQDTHTSFKEGYGDTSLDNIEKWKAGVVELKKDAPPASEVLVDDDKFEPDEAFTVVKDGKGKERIQVPTAKAAGVTILNLADIRWSQSDVKASTQDNVPLEDVIKYMNKGGWRGDPATVVEVGKEVSINGKKTKKGVQQGYTSQDNRRLLAALTAGLVKVPCHLMKTEDPLPVEWKVEWRDTLKKNVYWDKEEQQLIVGLPKEATNKTGKLKAEYEGRFELELAKGYIASTYGEVIYIRTANQPTVSFSDSQFDILGSREAPFYKKDNK